MPKRRNNAWSLRKKQKQIITARLIEISLKVDEYVYNRKPISNTQAEQLIKEVESYKTTCIRDERSLQVIEKLTRCMKAIILEHEKSDDEYMDDGDTFSLGENRPDSVSPVYSMCDDDRTQFSQTIDETGVNEGDDIINFCIDDDDNSTNSCTEDYIRPNQIDVEVDIHRAVSNLSLQEVPITEEPDTCSQSILNNFDDQMQPKLKNTPVIISNSSISNDDLQGKTTNFSRLNNSRPTNKAKQILDKSKQINTTSSIPGNTTDAKKKRAPRKKKNIETKENKSKKSPVKKKSNQKTKPPTSEAPKNGFDLTDINPKIPIYNDRVINDLSWIENIRFVREIRLDEYDQTLNLEESFWDNYHLPASWNDSEFL